MHHECIKNFLDEIADSASGNAALRTFIAQCLRGLIDCFGPCLMIQGQRLKIACVIVSATFLSK